MPRTLGMTRLRQAWADLPKWLRPVVALLALALALGAVWLLWRLLLASRAFVAVLLGLGAVGGGRAAQGRRRRQADERAAAHARARADDLDARAADLRARVDTRSAAEVIADAVRVEPGRPELPDAGPRPRSRHLPGGAP